MYCVMYAEAWGLQVKGLQFISNCDLKPLWQIFSVDSNVNLPCDNDYLYRFFWQLLLENEQNNDFLYQFCWQL